MKELAVIGSPSNVGGADTELGHQIICWLNMGIKVHVCHTGELDDNLLSIKEKFTKLGCVYHTPRDWAAIAGMHSISFCNGEFLKALPDIKKHVRSTSFVNCMTWNFPLEIEMQSNGFIDFHLYQTKHAFLKVSKQLENLGTYRPIKFKPYFHADEYPFIENRSSDRFRFGRISREDTGKFSGRQLWIYETMTAPVPKAGLILGWNDAIEKKVGKSPSYIAAMPAGWATQQDFYRFCDVVIMSTDTFENLPRVGFEAMASGSVLVVDNRGGWGLQVEDGVTGWLCNDEREFVYKASRVAFEKSEREAMRHEARTKLQKEWGMQSAMDSWDQVFKKWESI
jgi:glycosyltransferase involved in cell wall biosynthesis